MILKQRSLVTTLCLTIIFLCFIEVQAQNTPPWLLPDAPACFEAWMQKTASEMNTYQGSLDSLTSGQPYSFNQYGTLVPADLTVTQTQPDIKNKYEYMWFNFFSDNYWTTLRGLNVQSLHSYVLDCLGTASQTAPSPTANTTSLTAFDANATCPSSFSMHNNSTLTMICYCDPQASTGSLWGTSIYTSDSNLCKAAKHSGVIGTSGGMIVVKGAQGQDSYLGSNQNDINSASYNRYGWSFYFPNLGIPSPSTPIPSAGTPSVPAIERFDANTTQGWTSNYGEVSTTDGFLETTAPGDSLTSYYIAPNRYHGSWTSYTQLSFDLVSTGGSYYSDLDFGGYGDIYLANGSKIAHRSILNPHDGNWRNHTIPLYDDGEWTLSGGASSLSEVLSNITDFQIRAEYGSGADSSGLDNVRLE